jgi:GNAT superfamily N-acetyltransferase
MTSQFDEVNADRKNDLEAEGNQNCHFSRGSSNNAPPNTVPEYETFDSSEQRPRGYRIKVVRDFEDMAKVVAIRGAAYFSDDEHLYAKHFDGNDFSATHLLGFIDGEPVGTIRIRYFADFTRIERLAVRPTHRKSRMSFRLAKAAFAWCRDKGYETVGGVARSELIPFWTMLGFRLTEGKDPIYIYGQPHYDITLKLEPDTGAVRHMTDTMVLLRPEGRWHEAGHHETMNVTAPTTVAAAPPMVRRARRPADVAARLAEAGPASLGVAKRLDRSLADKPRAKPAAAIDQTSGQEAATHRRRP